MTTTTYPVRQFHQEMSHFIRKTVNFNDASIASGEVIGSVPAGARITSTSVFVETAFNSGGANTIDVNCSAGIGVGGTSLVSAQAAGSTAQSSTVPTAPNGIVASDSDITVRYNQTSTAATAGVATVIVHYIPNL